MMHIAKAEKEKRQDELFKKHKISFTFYPATSHKFMKWLES